MIIKTNNVFSTQPFKLAWIKLILFSLMEMSLYAQETVAPPAQETVAPPAQETVAPPAQETVAPPAQETVTPPAQETIEPAKEAIIPAQMTIPDKTIMTQSYSPDSHILQINLAEHLVVINNDKLDQDAYDFLVTFNDGQQCPLTKIEQRKNIFILSSRACPMEHKLRVGQPITVSLMAKQEHQVEKINSGNAPIFVSWGLINWEYLILESDIEEYPSGTKKFEFRGRNSTINTLPLVFDIDVQFANSGLLLKAHEDGGAFSPYLRGNFADMGLNVEYNQTYIKTTLIVEGIESSGSSKVEDGTAGMFIRKVWQTQNMRAESMFSFNYNFIYSKDTIKQKIRGPSLETTFRVLMNVFKNFSIGPSFEFAYLFLKYTAENSSGKLEQSGYGWELNITPIMIGFQF